MSDSERPDLVAVRELEGLIRLLGEEMAAWRRRAHEAEARLKGDGAPPPARPDGRSHGGSVAALERENLELRRRLEAARTRTKQLLEQLRFLRQQHELGAGGSER